MKNNDLIYKKLVGEAKRDPNIVGFFLNGSRGKKMETGYSDYDIEVVVRNGFEKSYKKKYSKISKPPFGFSVFSISEFRKYAEVGSPFEWHRASYAHLKPIVDKTGEIQKLIDKKAKIPKDKIKKYVAGYLDGYINGVYRSLKSWRDKNPIGARLEASRSIHPLLDSIFGLEARTTPYYKYLEWELYNYPLEKFTMKPKQLTKSLIKILEDGDVKTQQKLFRVMEKVFRKDGFGYIFDSWEGDSIKLIKTFRK